MSQEESTTSLPPLYTAENINRQDAASGVLDRVMNVVTRNPAACLASALVTGVIVGWLVKRK